MKVAVWSRIGPLTILTLLILALMPAGAEAAAPGTAAKQIVASAHLSTKNAARRVPSGNAQAAGGQRIVPFRPTISARRYANLKAAAARVPVSFKPAPVTTNSINPNATPHGTGINAFGVDQATACGSCQPPDTDGAAGLSHFVEVTQGHFDVYTRDAPPVLKKSVSLASFFGYTTKFLSFPRVAYDSTWNRWIVTALAFPESSTVQRLFMAVSTTRNPNGAFFIYNLNVAFFKGNRFDFLQLGMNQDALIFTANVFSSTNSYNGADMFGVAKARLYNGLGFSVPVFTGLIGTLAPPIVLDQSSTAVLAAAPSSGTTFSLYQAANLSSSNVALTGPFSVTVPSYSMPPDAHQPGVVDLIDTGDSRFVNASTQSGNDLWQVHTIALGGFPAPKFYRINWSTRTVTQSGSFFGSATSDDFNASIAANAAGNSFVTWTSTDSSQGVNARVRASGKLSADAGIAAGTAVFTSPKALSTRTEPERWGAYSSVTLDPLDTCRAWVLNETVKTTNRWGTRFARVGFC